MPKEIRLGTIELPAKADRYCFITLVEGYTHYLHLFPNGSHIWIKKWWDFGGLDTSVDNYRLISIDNDFPVKKAQRSIFCLCVLSNSTKPSIAISRMEKILNIISLNNSIGLRLMEETLQSLPAPKGYSDIKIEFAEGRIRKVWTGGTSVERFNPHTFTINKKGEIYTQYEVVPDLKGPLHLNAVVIRNEDLMISDN
jgi:hypothetical protein